MSRGALQHACILGPYRLPPSGNIEKMTFIEPAGKFGNGHFFSHRPRYSNQTLSLSVSLCIFLFLSLSVCLFLIYLSLSLSLSLPFFLSPSHTSYFPYFLARSPARSLPGSVHLNHEFLTITYRQYYLIRRGGGFLEIIFPSLSCSL